MRVVVVAGVVAVAVAVVVAIVVAVVAVAGFPAQKPAFGGQL